MKKPETKTEWNAYQAYLSCRVGIEAMDGKRELPQGTTSVEWGIYNLLHAVESLAQIHLPKEKQ